MHFVFVVRLLRPRSAADFCSSWTNSQDISWDFDLFRPTFLQGLKLKALSLRPGALGLKTIWLVSKWIPIFQPNVSKPREGCFKMSLPEFCTGSTGSGGSTTFHRICRKRIQLCRTDPGFPTPGVRMTVVNKLPQMTKGTHR